MAKKKAVPPASQTALPAPPSAHRIDDFLRRRLTWLVLALLVVLFAIHSWHAASIYLNPDEALHYRLAHQRSAGEAYTASNTNAHPPLLIVSLYYWSHIGRGEWFLRLPPMLCAIGLVWFAYLWGLQLAGPGVAVALAILLAFIPPVFTIATEVRHYPLALCFACGALYYLEAGLSRRSWRSLGISAVLLWLAILSNYSVLWFAAGFGVYSLWRVWKASLPRAATAVWAAGQAIALCMYGVLYVTHISKIGDTGMSKEARAGWLSSYYCSSDTAACLWRNTGGLWEYLFGHSTVAALGAVLFLFGVVVIWLRNRSLLLLIGVHFGACWGAVAAGLYPYGGTRHSILFALPVAIAVSFALSALSFSRLRFAAAGAVAMAALWLLTARPEMQAHKTPDHSLELARQSVAYLKERVPRGGLVFTDHQSMLLLCYYANRDGFCQDDSDRHFWQYELDGFRMISSKKWSLDPDDFVEELRLLKKEFHLERGAEVWTFDGGWGVPLNRTLTYRFGGTVLPGVREFGGHLTVFRIPN